MSSRRSGRRQARQAEESQWTWSTQPAWSEERQDWYWAATNEQGEVYYQWQNGQNAGSATPRTPQVGPGELAEAQVGNTYEDAAPGGNDGYNFTMEQSGGEGKGKAVYYSAADADGAGGGSGEGSSGDGGGTWPADPLLGRNDAGTGDLHDQEALPDQDYTSDFSYDQAPELQHALAASSGTYATPQQGHYVAHPQVEAGPSSTPHVNNPDYLDAYEGSDVAMQLRPDATTIPIIRATSGEVESADDRFRVMPSSMFQPGKVFKVLWADPMGQGRQPASASFTECTNIFTAYGEQFHTKYRRFIIVANDDGHATCVPIYTYLRQGCTKRGVKPKQHGIIHERGTEPVLLANEGQLGIGPVRMEMSPDVPEERLEVSSRVAYSKLTTVEHNVKVLFIGALVRADFDRIFRPAIDKVWGEKRHEPQPEHHHGRHHGRSTKHRRR